MWTGSQALNNIDQTLQSIRSDMVRLDQTLSKLSTTSANHQRRRAKIINDIATVRLAEIDGGTLLEALSVADRDAQQLMQQREQALEKLNRVIEQANEDLQAAESKRQTLLAQVNQVSQNIADIEAKVQQSLLDDEVYLSTLKQARLVQSIAEEADRKVEVAQQDMADKAKPYQADQLFMYLWNRGFGTTEYDGGTFARFMDGFVAKTIDYEKSRVNFWNLTEIPKRLADHANAKNNTADEAHMAVQQLELDALEAAGKNALEEDLSRLRSELDEFDDQLETDEAKLNQQLKERARFTSGQDDYISQSIKRLTSAIDDKNLDSVYQYVRATTSQTDDRLVHELKAIDDGVIDTGRDLAELRKSHEVKIDRLKQLEQVRRNFKNSRYDDVRSGFNNQSLLVGVLGQFLQGLISGSDLWRVIKRNQVFQNVGGVPDFGSGSLGELGDILGGGVAGKRHRSRSRRGHRRSTWHWPSSRGGGGGFRFPSGGGSRGSSGGGGFKTGGRF